ncbi:MAG: hypothetical protein IJH50_09055 [Kiritimatiellae bacterium]|nr:hypothetical protein [Kiritimatiellia bacterium]
MEFKIFISSVQREFAKERKALAEYVRRDAILGRLTVAMPKRRHRSIPVNPLLAQGMHLRGYIEHVGSGTGDIIEKCRESGLPPPQWESEDDGLTIILRRATIVSWPQTDKGAQDVDLGVGLDVGLERAVIDEIRARPKIRMSEIAMKYQVTKRTVERVFSKLTQQGRIARVGGKRFGHWEVLS